MRVAGSTAVMQALAPQHAPTPIVHLIQHATRTQGQDLARLQPERHVNQRVRMVSLRRPLGATSPFMLNGLQAEGALSTLLLTSSSSSSSCCNMHAIFLPRARIVLSAAHLPDHGQLRA
jgi:hypothetical protein